MTSKKWNQHGCVDSLLLLALILGGALFALHVLWFLRFVSRSTGTGGARRGRWYRW
ncbi:hydrophobic protein [Streptomyces sp. SID12501]|uniref:Hydrophobic protein n=1 Tax=Streptomyces sp. SID12501 TaxID=2706042 RepID=A0A6B3BLB7_9ACTN|nr:hydrophobic protein [Streptomyces sp. SID12501]NEC84899.1 hydrophobic protein [Streptomyces sp. SID12501]